MKLLRVLVVAAMIASGSVVTATPASARPVICVPALTPPRSAPSSMSSGGEFCYDQDAVDDPPWCNHYEFDSPISRFTFDMSESRLYWTFKESAQQVALADGSLAEYYHEAYENYDLRTYDNGTWHEAGYLYKGSMGSGKAAGFKTGDIVTVEVWVRHLNGHYVHSLHKCEVI